MVFFVKIFSERSRAELVCEVCGTTSEFVVFVIVS
jgi:hypothetical protein